VLKKLFFLLFFLLSVQSLLLGSIFVTADDYQLKEKTEEVFLRELGWKIDYANKVSVELKNLSLNRDIFIDKEYFSAILSVTADRTTNSLEFSFLIGEDQEFLKLYEKKLVDLIRENSYRWFDLESEYKIDDVLEAGFWSVAEQESFFVGERIFLEDYRKNAIGLLTVSDKQNFENKTLYELKPLWAKQSIIKGMPLSANMDKGSSAVSLHLFVNKIGISFSYDTYFKGSLFRFVGEAEASVDFYSYAVQTLFYGGFLRTLSLGSLAKKESIGKWWTNISFTAAVKLGVGFAKEGQFNFIYGTKGTLVFSYHSCARLFYSIGLSYRYLFDSYVSDLESLSIVSSIGWLW